MTSHSPAAVAAAHPPPPDTGRARDLLLRELDGRWPADGRRLDRIARYALLPAGKFLRPVLLAESARAVGAGGAQIAPAALGVEFLHVGSLVHDDVIDGDELRRGRPSVMARHGVADAVVVGDALMMSMFAAVAECAERGLPAGRVVEAVRVLAAAGVDLCHGQLMEAELCGDAGCGLERYLAVSALKTGALFRAACLAGAVLGGGTPAQQRALRRYGEHLGSAFQMRDDLLPYVGDAGVTGKSGLSDLANRRPTFPLVVAHDRADRAGRRLLERVLSGAVPAAEALGAVAALLRRTGALAAAEERARQEVAAAKGCLAELPATSSRTLLERVADFSADRAR
ncbi:polyprenyl synthetase family protein [Streptomyces sp. SL13]|uniref:Polyprenyl synthetase family protein n=1 Tax=Streptantibioticus silvisoli TaxID=2705255 RepID=A0AA90HAQ3_9ACTN|nr:polyprenyl synthetase family protein [Streptantibioticus silvisoli]MDI5967257.1 polyprenyl synthetase family protein [Streptantibioticus silvisoli]MDI5971227.1 polyprenyl synthetase family protein [Streptantibioticus silvisoli]